MEFAVTALLFESDYDPWAVTNAYRVVDGNKSATGEFGGKYVSDTGISMPNNSAFLTIVIPNVDQTATQKITATCFNNETMDATSIEYDLEVEVV